MISLLKLLREAIAPSVILGAVTQQHRVIAKYSYTDNERHPPEWERYVTFRYLPDFETIFWWVPPSEDDKLAAVSFLNKNHFIVRRHSIRTPSPLPKKED